MSTAFTSIDLHPDLLRNIDSLGLVEMMPIQAASLPPILSGKDVIAQSKTGSGKTVAFGLGLLHKIDTQNLRVQALVLCPTRELADQVSKVLRQLARTLPNIKLLTLCGGMPSRAQVTSLSHGAHIVVGTPGRIAKHLRTENLNVDALQTLVLDEGDRMLEMGFQDELDMIIDALPKPRQTLLFSATYPDTIRHIAERVMTQPIMVKVESTHDETSIQQHFYTVDTIDERLIAVRLLLLQHRPESAVVFCNTKKDCMAVTDELIKQGFSALDLHGDLEQNDRDETLIRFANKSLSILVSTDVAARGLDIDSLDVVINFHLAHDAELHVHRIGRTGRAGSKGIAYSLFSDNEARKVARLEEYLGQSIEGEPLPDSELLNTSPMSPTMTTLKINAGRKQKLRPGNILGALTGEDGIEGSKVGKIHINDKSSYVAVSNSILKPAMEKLSQEKWKGRPLKGWLLED